MNVFPQCFSLDSRNQRLRNVVLVRDDLVNARILANLGNLIGTEFRVPSSLLQHVFHIVGLSSKEKMIWIATHRNIAFVKNEKTMGNYPYEFFICRPMGELILPITLQETVSLFIQYSSPKPATGVGLWRCSGINKLFYRGRRTGTDNRFRHVLPPSRNHVFRAFGKWRFSDARLKPNGTTEKQPVVEF